MSRESVFENMGNGSSHWAVSCRFFKSPWSSAKVASFEIPWTVSVNINLQFCTVNGIKKITFSADRWRKNFRLFDGQQLTSLRPGNSFIENQKLRTVLTLKMGPFRWLKCSPIFESNLTPLIRTNIVVLDSNAQWQYTCNR